MMSGDSEAKGENRMQTSPAEETRTVSYQVPRNVLIRIWWRRLMLHPRRLLFVAVLIAVSAVCFVVKGGAQYAGILFCTFLVMMPISLYRVLAKTADTDQVLTDPKTLQFSPSQLVVSGPGWKTEMPWTRFKRFSEDDAYFYLELASNSPSSVIPKSAFSAEQQEAFRKYAHANIV